MFGSRSSVRGWPPALTARMPIYKYEDIAIEINRKLYSCLALAYHIFITKTAEAVNTEPYCNDALSRFFTPYL